MRELSLKERKNIGLNLLKNLDEICSAYSVPYFLAYGTLIGAVRHHGFIPWDDDIDIWVPITDYKRLLSLLDERTVFDVIDNTVDINWPRGFAKFSDPDTIIVDNRLESKYSTERGVSIDIFPIFQCKNDIQWIKRTIKTRNNIVNQFCYRNGILETGSSPKGIAKKIISGASKIMGHDQRYYVEKLYEIETELQDAEIIGCPISPYEERDIFHKEWFASSEKLEFEGRTFPVPIGWDNVLRKLYGNYMELPPADQRVSNHNVKAFLKEG